MGKPILWMAVWAISAAACSQQAAESGQAAVDVAVSQPLVAVAADDTAAWAGRYRGKLACADCDYIEAELALHSNLTYRFKSRHVGRVAGELPVIKSGSFVWRNDGLVQLDAAGDNMVFFVAGGALEMRGNDGKAYPDRHGKICRLQKEEAFNPLQ